MQFNTINLANAWNNNNEQEKMHLVGTKRKKKSSPYINKTLCQGLAKAFAKRTTNPITIRYIILPIICKRNKP